MKGKILLGVVTFLLALMWLFVRLEALELSYHEVREIEFESQGNRLSGSLYLPDSPPPYDLVFFIHGDGPQDRTSKGNYNFIMNHLMKQGFACFSYDKAGVGKSQGNWLEQTMAHRGNEVIEALNALEATEFIRKKGLLAFSQGGWVLSELAQSKASVDFMIVVGGAIDWMDQHLYYESQFAKKRGYSPEETEAYLTYVRGYDALIDANDYEAYVAFVEAHAYEKPMTQSRFHFAYLNKESNAIDGIRHMKVPFLGIFGAEDMNVDVSESYRVYDEIFNQMGKTDYALHVFPEATHSLVKRRYEGREGLMAFGSLIYGDKVFADGVFETLSEWIMGVCG